MIRHFPIFRRFFSQISYGVLSVGGLRSSVCRSCGQVLILRRKPWAEAKIKALTGGDPIQARFMRADFFEFQPTFKLWIVGNHKPVISSVDEAIRRRLHLIPFTITVPPEARDDGLTDKLIEESAGIMQWAIEGALLWRTQRLSPPEIVRAATEEYFSEQDAVAEWIESKCDTENLPVDQRETSKDLFESWSKWALDLGEDPRTSKWFGEQLQKHGITPHRTEFNRGFKGIRLRRPDGTNREGC
jgi:putative DNA primase/helicase